MPRRGAAQAVLERERRTPVGGAPEICGAVPSLRPRRFPGRSRGETRRVRTGRRGLRFRRLPGRDPALPGGPERPAPSPHILYNLGEAAYRLGDLPLAKGYFERAHRLAPLDPVITEDLRQVNTALKLPEYDGGAIGRYRDALRPDWYLMIAATALAVLAVAGAVRRKRRRC